jgi:NADH dehydrogenase
MHRVIVVGGGFGGLRVTRGLRRAPVSVTLVDRHNYHLFQPLLYQVATGTLSPANIASPLRALVKRQQNAQVLLGEVRGIDLNGRQVQLDGQPLTYDTLVLAAGSSHSYFGHDDWARFAPSLKSLDDATAIRGRILSAFEAAERATDPDEIRAWLTFVVIGGGPTGVEMVGQLAEIARQTLRGEFRSIHPEDAAVILLEAADRVLPVYPPKLSAKAESDLKDLQVRVVTRGLVTHVDAAGVTYQRDKESVRISARTVLWAAGVQASPLAKMVADAAGLTTDRSGRVPVQADLTLAGHADVFVIGDMARLEVPPGHELPALAPVAIQQATYVAKSIALRLAGQAAQPPFEYRDLGTMATIGRRRAVADFGFLRLTGTLAWLAWLFVHLMSLVEFRNRLLVLIQWGINYLTRNRAARLITGRRSDEIEAG